MMMMKVMKVVVMMERNSSVAVASHEVYLLSLKRGKKRASTLAAGQCISSSAGFSRERVEFAPIFFSLR